MGKYGQTAIRAVQLLRKTPLSAEAAWRNAAAEVFSSDSSRAKICPREAFLGLCQHGLLDGVSRDRCTPSDSSKNRQYAIVGARLVASDPYAKGRVSALWRLVMTEVGADPEKVHNQQLDVVLSLRANGHLVI
jgi:hypothetical protein